MPHMWCEPPPPPPPPPVPGEPPEYVIVSTVDVLLPARSVAVIVMSFVPGPSGIEADHDVVPVAVPL